MRLLALIFLFFGEFFAEISGEHVTIYYHFWEKDSKIAEKAEFYSRFLANSNQYWTSNLEYVQNEEKIDKIQVSSDNWKTASVEEVINIGDNLDHFFLSLIQKFAEKLYTNLALDSIPVFNPQIFTENYHIYQDYVVSPQNNLWVEVEKEKDRQKYTYVLLVKKRTFEHWEAVMHYVDAIKRTGLRGYLVDCEKEGGLCSFNVDDGKSALIAYKDEVAHKFYDGDFEKDHVHDWMLTIEQPEVRILKEDIVPRYRSGLVPGFKEPRDTVTILFIPSKKSQIWRNYVKFAKESHGQYHLAAVVSKEVKQWSIYPAFITMKPRDPFVKAFTLHKDITYDRMVDWLEEGLHPSCHSISSPSEFLYATSSKPLLIFFDPLDNQNVTKFKNAASQEQTQERIVHFAAITGFDLFGMYIMSVFNIDSPNYVLLQRLDKGWCALTRQIGDGDYSKLQNWLENLDYSLCQVKIEDFKFPVSRLHLLERYDDVEELEKEHSAIERNRDEL